jgi:indole-3-glycerol phosphate synthase/phosphoribosylanthranilate isomerase
MTNILSEILDRKRRVVARLRADPASREFRRRALTIRAGAAPHRLLQELESKSLRPKIIAEFKRRSPSAGIIRDDLSAPEVARCYERGGACAISVLTDEEYFGGSIFDLCAVRASTSLPLLRKDFIIDSIQLYETAIAGADSALLIADALDDADLSKLRAIAEDELGIDAVIEVHTSEELPRVLRAGAKIIGVNNRDLRTFQTSLDTSERLIAEAPRDRVMISESGLQNPESLRHLQTLGFRGFLIGEALMGASDPEAALRDFIAGAEDQPSPQLSCSHRPVAGPAGSPTTHSAAATADRSNWIQIKICGVANEKDARACAELGADMIGFNFYPKSPRYVEPEAVREIVNAMPRGTCSVGVFVDADVGEIRKTAELAGVRCVQLHGETMPATCSDLARDFRVICAFPMNAQFRPENVAAFADCDVLIDAYHPEFRGGSGQTCDWSAARETLRFTQFLILSGGLNAQNVGRAIAEVMPQAVDVCSGTESAPAVKDHRALEGFINAVRAAERNTNTSSLRR